MTNKTHDKDTFLSMAKSDIMMRILRMNHNVLFAEPVCSSVYINSSVEAHTFPGTFTYDSEYNDRPAYRNDEQGVYLYFHSRGICHMWAVAESIDANQWLLYSYDIAPRPNEVVAPWNVARTDGWTDDDTINIACV